MTKPRVQFETLDNGLQLVFLPNPGLRSVVVLAGCHVGSRFETMKQWGASHFLEHMVFKGTKKRPTTKDISAIVDSRGGDFNAGTDKELTYFYVHLGAQGGPVAVDVIHDLIQNPLLRNQDINKERAVIQEEISTYDNDDNTQIWELSDRHTYAESMLGKPICGTRQSVCFPNSTIRDFFHQYYTPSNMMVILSGAVDENLKAVARKKFKTLKGEPLVRTEDLFPKYQPGLAFQAGKTDRIHLHVNFPGVSKNSTLTRHFDLLMMVLGGYSSARLYQSLREDKGLCYSVNANSINVSDSGVLVSAMSLEKEKFQKSLFAILAEIKDLRKNGVKKDEFKNAKSAKAGYQARVLDNPMHTCLDVLYQKFLTGDYTDVDTDLALYQSVKLSEVNELISDFLSFENLQVSVVGPPDCEEMIQEAYVSATRKFKD